MVRIMHWYFSGKRETSVAINAKDPLYPKVKCLTSSEVRKILSVENYPQLKKLASKDDRSVSGYVKHKLRKVLLSSY